VACLEGDIQIGSRLNTSQTLQRMCNYVFPFNLVILVKRYVELFPLIVKFWFHRTDNARIT